MNDKVKIAAIAGATIIAIVGLITYCSPYQTCVREYEAQGVSMGEITCAQIAK